MSSRPRTARAEAVIEVRQLIDKLDGVFDRWTVAGSLRRGRLDVGDAEHVVIPRTETIMPAAELDLFGVPTAAPEPIIRNLLLERLDELVAAGSIFKAVKGDGATRWGERYRALTLTPSGMHHEIFLTDRLNYGAILAIRTGPQEVSTKLVSRLAERGYRQADGYLRKVERELQPDGEVREVLGELITVESEEKYFELAGWKSTPPAVDRDNLAAHFRRAGT